jgi:hypothetical protein
MVQSHDPPSPESGRDKRYYGHVMKDFHEQYESVGQSHKHNNIYNYFLHAHFTNSNHHNTTPTHEYQAQTLAGVLEVLPTYTKNSSFHIKSENDSVIF